ncbi:MAG: NAD-dependent epimerase/dehydratase family protein [Chloroflexota bacterium]|nr:NAD-dependent epimerase/dehydratase family protein [Chloroflexota bacterium]
MGEEIKTVLITGSTGLLGGHLVERMTESGYGVRALARQTSDISHLKTTGAEIVFGDVEDYDSLVSAAKGKGVIIHAAARVLPGWGEWPDFEHCIINGTENILNASIEAGVKRFVYVSSGTVVGEAALGDTPADESAPYLDVELTREAYYDCAKAKAEQIVLDYHKQGKISAVVVRPCMVYGPRCRLLTDRIYRYVKMFPVLPGNAMAKTALVHVHDVVDCIMLAATSEKSGGQIYNISPEGVVTYRDFINSMARATGKSDFRLQVPLSVVYASAAVMEFWGRLIKSKDAPFLTRSDLKFVRDGMYIDSSKARKELGWQPKTSIEEGCRQYVEWRKSQKKNHK